ncbi:MAG: 4a-hydroxytetrahydrobiopterin dehydratase [Micrococcaceae bacterium]
MAQHELTGWRVVRSRLETAVKAPGFTEAVAFINKVAEIAEEQNHHPDIDLRYHRVRIRVFSHDVGALTARDARFAAAVDEVIEEAGLVRELDRIGATIITIDAVDVSAVKPFWLAVTGYTEGEDDLLEDPSAIEPALWFQPADELREQRSTTHVDVHVAADQAEERVRAAVAAGGRLLTEEHAPSFWVLADTEGNEVCVCTTAAPPGSVGPYLLR